MLVKYKGRGPGPVTASTLLSRVYDFTSGQCEMADQDASLLLKRCAGSYQQIEYPPTPDSPTIPVVPVNLKAPEPKLYTKRSSKVRK